MQKGAMNADIRLGIHTRMVILVVLFTCTNLVTALIGAKPPSFRKPPITDRVALVADDLKLFCRVKGTPKPYVKWFYEGNPLAVQDRIKIDQKGLEIINLTLNDSGRYACRAQNPFGSIWGNFTVTVTESYNNFKPQIGEDEEDEFEDLEGPPKWSNQKDSVVYIAGAATQDVTLDCSVRGHPNPTIEWFKDGQKTEVVSDSKKYSTKDWKLTISYLSKMDKGNYKCVLTNTHGSLERTYNVDVIERLRAAPIIEGMKNVTVLEGQNATFSCKILVSDSQPLLQWLKHYKVNNSFTDENGNPLVHLLQQSGYYFLLKNVTEEDEGWYTCLAANSVGMNYKSAYLHVVKRRLRGPSGTGGIRNTTVLEGQNALFACKIPKNDSQLSVRWLKENPSTDENGNPIEHPSKKTGYLMTMDDPQYLLLENVTKADEGWYACFMETSLGIIYESAYLHVVDSTLFSHFLHFWNTFSKGVCGH